MPDKYIPPEGRRVPPEGSKPATAKELARRIAATPPPGWDARVAKPGNTVVFTEKSEP